MCRLNVGPLTIVLILGYVPSATLIQVMALLFLHLIRCVMCFQVSSSIDVTKIDENRCKKTLAGLPCFWGYRKSQFTVIRNLPQNTANACTSDYVIFTCLEEI